MNTEINVRSPDGSNRAKMLWTMCDAQERGEDHCDPASEQKIIHRNVVWQELWTQHLVAKRRVEEWEEAHSSTAGGSRT